MAGQTAACALCPDLIVLAEPHVGIERCVETERRGEVTKHEAELIARMHLACSDRLQLTAAADEPVTAAP